MIETRKKFICKCFLPIYQISLSQISTFSRKFLKQLQVLKFIKIGQISLKFSKKKINRNFCWGLPYVCLMSHRFLFLSQFDSIFFTISTQLRNNSLDRKALESLNNSIQLTYVIVQIFLWKFNFQWNDTNFIELNFFGFDKLILLNFELYTRHFFWRIWLRKMFLEQDKN